MKTEEISVFNWLSNSDFESRHEGNKNEQKRQHNVEDPKREKAGTSYSAKSQYEECIKLEWTIGKTIKDLLVDWNFENG